MEARELAQHDVDLVAAATAEHSVVLPPVSGDAKVEKVVAGLVTRVYVRTTNFLNIWKDERGNWSTRRILLWTWTLFGLWVMRLEVVARVYIINGTIVQPHPLNNAWIQAWQITEGALIVAVFGPVMVDYFRNAAPAMTAIGGALRDKIIDPIVTERRDQAADAGSDGTEWTE